MSPPGTANPASAAAQTGSGDAICLLSSSAADDRTNSQIQAPAQDKFRNPRAVRESTIASILDESHWLLGSLTLQASIAQQFAELGDARGFLYSLDQVVKQAIRAGAEGVELRKIRKEMRGAPVTHDALVESP